MLDFEINIWAERILTLRSDGQKLTKKLLTNSLATFLS